MKTLMKVNIGLEGMKASDCLMTLLHSMGGYSTESVGGGVGFISFFFL